MDQRELNNLVSQKDAMLTTIQKFDVNTNIAVLKVHVKALEQLLQEIEKWIRSPQPAYGYYAIDQLKNLICRKLLSPTAACHSELIRMAEQIAKFTIEASPIVLEVSEKLLDEYWSHFSNIFFANNADVNETSQQVLEIFRNVEASYMTAKVKVKALLTENANGRSISIGVNVKFHGSDAEWPNFRDCFVEWMGKNSALSEKFKLEYLKQHLHPSVEQKVEKLKSAKNYTEAWRLLENHYENVDDFLSAKLDKLRKLKNNEPRDVMLREFIQSTEQMIQLLKTKQTPTDNWTSVRKISREFDEETGNRWELAIDQLVEPPTLQFLLKFLKEEKTTL